MDDYITSPMQAPPPSQPQHHHQQQQHRMHDVSKTSENRRLDRENFELRQQLSLFVAKLQQEQEKLHQESSKNKHISDLYNRVCETYQRSINDQNETTYDYAQTMRERDDVLRKLEIAETNLDQYTQKCMQYDSQNRELQHAITTLRSEVQLALKERDQFRLQLGENDETLQKLRQNFMLLTGNGEFHSNSMQELEHLRSSVERWQTERNVYMQERQELQDQVKNAQQGRQLAFELRETAVKERESMSHMCNEVRRARDEHVTKLADALRQLDELKWKQQDAVKRAAQAQERVEILQRNNCMLLYKIQQQPSTMNNSSDSAVSSIAEVGKSDDVLPGVHYQTLEIEVEISSAKGFEKFEDLGLSLTYNNCVDLSSKLSRQAVVNVVHVRRVASESPFASSIKPNDRLIRVNNNKLEGATVSSVPSYILSSVREDAHVSFLVSRRVPPPQPTTRVLDVNFQVPSSSSVAERSMQLESNVFVTAINNDESAQQLMVGDRIVAINGNEIDSHHVEYDAAKYVAEQIQSHAGRSVELRVSRFMPSCCSDSSNNAAACRRKKRYILSNDVQYADKAVQAGSSGTAEEEEEEDECDQHDNASSPITPTNVDDERKSSTDNIKSQRSTPPNKFSSLPRNVLLKPYASSSSSGSTSKATMLTTADMPNDTFYPAEHYRFASDNSEQSNSSSTATTKAAVSSSGLTAPLAVVVACDSDTRIVEDDAAPPPPSLLPPKKLSSSYQRRVSDLPVEKKSAVSTNSNEFERNKPHQRPHTMFYAAAATPSTSGGNYNFATDDAGTEEAAGHTDVAGALSAFDHVLSEHARQKNHAVLVGDNLYDVAPSNSQQRHRAAAAAASRHHVANHPVSSQFHPPSFSANAGRYDDEINNNMGRSVLQPYADHHHFFTMSRVQARRLAAAVSCGADHQSPSSFLLDSSTSSKRNGTSSSSSSKPSVLSKAKKFFRKVSDKVPGNSSKTSSNNFFDNNNKQLAPATAVGSHVKLRRGSYGATANHQRPQQASSCGSSALVGDDFYSYERDENGNAELSNNTASAAWPRERQMMRPLTAAFAGNPENQAAYANAAGTMDDMRFPPAWHQQQQQFVTDGSRRPFSMMAPRPLPLTWSPSEFLTTNDSLYAGGGGGGVDAAAVSPRNTGNTKSHRMPSNAVTLNAVSPFLRAPHHHFTSAAAARFSAPPGIPRNNTVYNNNNNDNFYRLSSNSSTAAVADGGGGVESARAAWAMPPSHQSHVQNSQQQQQQQPFLQYSAGGVSSSSSACREEFQYASGGEGPSSAHHSAAAVASFHMPLSPPLVAFDQWPAAAAAAAAGGQVLTNNSQHQHHHQFYEGLYDRLPFQTRPAATLYGQNAATSSQQPVYDTVLPSSSQPASSRAGGHLTVRSSMERIQQQVRKQKPPPAGVRSICIQRPSPSTASSSGGSRAIAKTKNNVPLGIEVDEVELQASGGVIEKAVLIVSVAKDSPSDRAGLCVGDQLLDLNGLNLRSTNKPDLGIVRNILLIVTTTDVGEETVNMKVQYRGADVLRSVPATPAAATSAKSSDVPQQQQQVAATWKEKQAATQTINKASSSKKSGAKSPTYASKTLFSSASSGSKSRQHPSLTAVFSNVDGGGAASSAAAPAKPRRRSAVLLPPPPPLSFSIQNPTPNTNTTFTAPSSSCRDNDLLLCPPKSDKQTRIVLVQKAQNENIGITLVGGNVLGIYVHTIADDSPVKHGRTVSRSSKRKPTERDESDDERVESDEEANDGESPLKPGDQILTYNGKSFSQATAEQASLEVSKPAPRIEFIVQHHPQGYALALERPGDAFYVRALFDYHRNHHGASSGDAAASNDEELSFRRGQVLLVDCTVHKGCVGRWRAWLLDERGEKKDYGLIPNRYGAEEYAVGSSSTQQRRRHGRKQNDSVDSNDSMTKRWSFFVRRKRQTDNNSEQQLPSEVVVENDQLYAAGFKHQQQQSNSKNSIGKAFKFNSNKLSMAPPPPIAREVLSITFDDMTLTDSDAGGAESENEKIPTVDAGTTNKLNNIFPTYERVVRVEYAEKRPVVLLGPFSEQISNLLVEYPVFAHCPFELLQPSNDDDVIIEKKRSASTTSQNVEAITASVVHDICARNYHCLLVPTTVSASNDGATTTSEVELILQRLRKARFFPVVILVQFKSAKVLKEALTQHTMSPPSSAGRAAEAASTTTALLKTGLLTDVYDRSVQMETDLKSEISAVVRTTSFKFAVMQIIDVVDKEQRKALWIPFSDSSEEN